MEPCSITRTVRISAGTDEVWESVGRVEGLAGWLGGAVDVDLTPGEAGSFVDHDGVTRRLVVTELDEGRRVGFVWWDEDRPSAASSVVIAVDGDGDGARVTVTETVDPVAVGALGGRASARTVAEVADVIGIGHRWDARLASLVGAAPGALVGARV